MSWTTPITWVDETEVEETEYDADIFNEQIRDNLNWLKNRQGTSCQIFQQVINFDTIMSFPEGWSVSQFSLWQLAPPSIVFDVFAFVTVPWNSSNVTIIMGDASGPGFFTLSGSDLTSIGWKLLRPDQKGNFLYHTGKKWFKCYSDIAYGQGTNNSYHASQGQLYVFWICYSPNIQILEPIPPW